MPDDPKPASPSAERLVWTEESDSPPDRPSRPAAESVAVPVSAPSKPRSVAGLVGDWPRMIVLLAGLAVVAVFWWHGKLPESTAVLCLLGILGTAGVSLLGSKRGNGAGASGTIAIVVAGLAALGGLAADRLRT